ncbi:MAG TPA: DUF5320 domain-containing protein [Candidatus Wallbacteria bacterium]|nr:MAG: hypothetical protein BWY32_00258 [bacterium ADurb.Bin243]HOD40357.1 DUF5320 domain-containing protein [Candidatus Wallbacteria bacterium]HPG56395.1 DUF5320 domain-containing protein [Candidatus Wallbacteria bacterium]
MSNFNGMGPSNNPEWVCRRKNSQPANFGGRGMGNFCRFGGAGRGNRFNANFNDAGTFEAKTDTAAEINALKEKISSLEETLNKLKSETGEY